MLHFLFYLLPLLLPKRHGRSMSGRRRFWGLSSLWSFAQDYDSIIPSLQVRQTGWEQQGDRKRNLKSVSILYRSVSMTKKERISLWLLLILSEVLGLSQMISMPIHKSKCTLEPKGQDYVLCGLYSIILPYARALM